MRPYIRILMLSILTTGLTSCLYSTRYVATYEIQPTVNINQTDIEIRETVNKLSGEHKLTTDDKYNQTDTLGYFGKPYHYFKYWTSKQDTVIKLTLHYNGVFGNQSHPPYETMLEQLTADLKNQFNVLDSEIDEESNKKLGRKKN